MQHSQLKRTTAAQKESPDCTHCCCLWRRGHTTTYCHCCVVLLHCCRCWCEDKFPCCYNVSVTTNCNVAGTYCNDKLGCYCVHKLGCRCDYKLQCCWDDMLRCYCNDKLWCHRDFCHCPATLLFACSWQTPLLWRCWKACLRFNVTTLKTALKWCLDHASSFQRLESFFSICD